MAEMLTTARLARLLAVSETTIRTWRKHGVGPPFQKFGRLVRYDKAAFADWLSSKTPIRSEARRGS